MTYFGLDLDREAGRVAKRIEKLTEDGSGEEKETEKKAGRREPQRRRGGFVNRW